MNQTAMVSSISILQHSHCLEIVTLFSVALNEFEVESNISKTTSTNFTVTLSWEREIGTHFTVHVVPDADLNFTSTTKVQVTMSYSVSYTVTIVGTRCGQNVSMVVKEFNYSESFVETVRQILIIIGIINVQNHQK